MLPMPRRSRRGEWISNYSTRLLAYVVLTLYWCEINFFKFALITCYKFNFCIDVIHTNCLISHIKSFPPHTAPAGYVCPSCPTSVRFIFKWFFLANRFLVESSVFAYLLLIYSHYVVLIQLSSNLKHSFMVF